MSRDVEACARHAGDVVLVVPDEDLERCRRVLAADGTTVVRRADRADAPCTAYRGLDAAAVRGTRLPGRGGRSDEGVRAWRRPHGR